MTMKDITNDILNSYQRLQNNYSSLEKAGGKHSKHCRFFKPINKPLRDIQQNNEVVRRANNG